MNYYGGMTSGGFTGGSCCGCGSQFMPFQTFGGWGCGCGGNNNSSYYAIILVLFILLVIVIGSRFNN